MHSILDVSKRLGISRSLVYGEIHSGQLRAHRFGKRTYRVSEGDLQDYIEEHGHAAVSGQQSGPDSSKAAEKTKLKAFKHVDVSRLLSSQNPPGAAGRNGRTARSSPSKCDPGEGSSS